MSFRPRRSSSFAVRRIVPVRRRVRPSAVPSCIVRYYNPHGSAPVYTRFDWDAILPLAVRNHWFDQASFYPFPVPFGGLIQVDMPPAVTSRDPFFFPYGFVLIFQTAGLVLVSSTGSTLDVGVYDVGLGFWVVSSVRVAPVFVLLLIGSASPDYDVASFNDGESGSYLVAASPDVPVAENYVIEVAF
jgi:hypothetical protein